MLRVECLHRFSSDDGVQESLCSADPSTGSHDQLVTRGQEVTWLEGLDPDTETVKKVYSAETPILQAFWCRFPEEGVELAACASGSRVVLVKWVWPLDCGVVVERQLAAGSAYDGFPTLFSLLHPLDDFCPLTCHRRAATDSGVKVVGFFGEPGLEVLDVCYCAPYQLPLVLSYHAPSKQHHIWCLRHTTKEDIPAHLTTPQRPQTPAKPLSTSDPSCYGTPMMNTPVEMILSSRRPHPTTGKQKVPLLQLPQFGVCGLVPPGSGRSPCVGYHVPTPNSGAAFAKKCSKSLSPPAVARMSPFSQTVDSHSWSTFYSEELSFGLSFEPLLPQRCLHLLWDQCPEEVCTQNYLESKASSLFCTWDLTGARYVGVVIPSSHQVWLISSAGARGGAVELGCVAQLAGTHAVSFEELGVMLVWDPQQDLALYSGPSKVCAVDVEGVARGLGLEEQTAVGISDVIDTNFSLSFKSGVKVRCSLPALPHLQHPIIELCVRALKQVLPRALALKLLCCYARGCWTTLPPPDRTLQHFLQWLGACLGSSHSCTEPVGRTSESRALQQLPALKLLSLGSYPSPSPCGHAMDTAPPGGSVAMDTVCLESYRRTAVLSLHLVYEELKLRGVAHEGVACDDVKELASFLHCITSWLGWYLYADYYCRDYPSFFTHTPPPSSETGELMDEDTATPMVPSSPSCLYDWLLRTLHNLKPPPFPVIPSVCTRTVQVIKLYSLLVWAGDEALTVSSFMSPLTDCSLDTAWTSAHSCSSPPHERVLLQLVAEGMTQLDLDLLPVGVALPLLDCIHCCREAPPMSLPLAAYHLIGRGDLARMLDGTTPTLKTPCLEEIAEGDGMNLDLEVLKLRFPQDLRAKEVRRMLQSSEPVRVSITQEPEISDHEFIQQQEARLLAICQRTMALPVGRGMFTFSTVHPLPTSPVHIPALNLSGRVPVKNSSVGLDHVDKPVDMTQWPDFHNGVAAGLRLAAGSSKLDVSWIMFNKPSRQNSSNTYAGFLMALGLSGHLASFQDYDLYTYLEDKHELTVVGLLLGVAASNCGCANPSLVSLLSIYFHPLLPPGSADMEISQTMQTAAITGIGLLFMGSANRHMAEVVLGEIGHTPGPELEFAENRESYSLSAGLALGMITLGLGGGELPGLADLHLEDQLLHLMNGGRKRETRSARTNSTPSQLVMEGCMVNTHVTAPGAIMALGLMYLKTNSRTVAAMLQAPNTHYELDCVRPDFLLYRTLSRGLVMWDDIEATHTWIHRQIPSVVHEGVACSKEEREGTLDLQTLYQARAYITAGCCFAIALKFAGSCEKKAYNCLLEKMLSLKEEDEAVMGKHCIEQCLQTILLGIAMVKAGSGDLDVLRLIRKLHVRVLSPEVTYGSHMATHMALGLLFLGSGRYTLSSSNEGVASLLCSLFPCFPQTSQDNRYHLQALRHLYVLAAQPGVLVTRDMLTGTPCCVGVQVKVGGQVKETVTPCLIRNWDQLEQVRLMSAGHWPLTLELAAAGSGDKIRSSLARTGILYVQERVSKAQVVGEGGEGVVAVKGKVDIPQVKDPLFVPGLSSVLSQQQSSCSKFMAHSLVECVDREVPLGWTVNLRLEEIVKEVTAAGLQSCLCLGHLIDQLKLASAYFKFSSFLRGATPSPAGCGLLSEQYLAALQMRIWQRLWEGESILLTQLRAYFLDPQSKWVESRSVEDMMLLALCLVWAELPTPSQLSLSPSGTLPDLYLKLQTVGVSNPAFAAVRLMPLLQHLHQSALTPIH